MIERLNTDHKNVFSRMNDDIVNQLDDKSFLIPFSKEDIDDIFNYGAKDVVCGIFHENEIAAMAGLYFHLDDFESQKDYLNIDFSKAGTHRCLYQTFILSKI